MWISARDNWSRITAAGLQDRVFPIHAEAHALPYAEGFFDALVSFDAATGMIAPCILTILLPSVAAWNNRPRGFVENEYNLAYALRPEGTFNA